MTDATAKLCSIRHYCFIRGVVGNRKKGHDEPPEDDFLQAFRTINRLYVQARDGIASNAQVYRRASVGDKRSKAA